VRKIDWGYYTQLLWWELRVACALSLAKDPESFERDHPYDGSSAGAAVRLEFDKRMNLLSHTLASQQVFSAPLPGMSYYKHVRPAEFVKWAQGQGLPLPAELMQLIPATVAADAESVPTNTAAQPQHALDHAAISQELVESARPADDVPAATGDARPAATANKQRSNILDQPIGVAIEKAGNHETADVWLQLKELALTSTPPFSGEVSDRALDYTNAGNSKASFTKKSLGQRLRRIKEDRQRSKRT